MSVNKSPQLQIIPKDRTFFEKLYCDYYSSLVKFAEAILFDSEEAKDVVQEVFIDLWNKSHNIHIENTIKTYLYSCVKYKSYNRIKKLNIIDKHQEQMKEAYLFAQEYNSLPDEDLQNKIRETLNKFPKQMRKVLECHTLYGWKYQEIADEMGISINSVKTHVKRAYKKFRKEMTTDFMPVVMIWYLVDQFFL